MSVNNRKRSNLLRVRCTELCTRQNASMSCRHGLVVWSVPAIHTEVVGSPQGLISDELIFVFAFRLHNPFLCPLKVYHPIN